MDVEGERACDCTTRYQSVLCFGTTRIFPDGQEKVELLTALSEKYTDRALIMPTLEMAQEATLIEIRVAEMTGKRNVIE
jgi:nitroimidazol reductase NimA-like FMN-containing flavoprotein (pyridoxamine 5'-phosphate oxidase superfamily)